MSALALVVGLGNPGDRYVGTRHNVGFEVLDALVRRLSADPSRPTRVDRLDCRALTGRVRIGDAPVLLAKPQTYMNLSGESVKGLLVKHSVPRERMLVVSDDVALPVGRLRIRRSTFSRSGVMASGAMLMRCLPQASRADQALRRARRRGN